MKIGVGVSLSLFYRIKQFLWTNFSIFWAKDFRHDHFSHFFERRSFATVNIFDFLITGTPKQIILSFIAIPWIGSTSVHHLIGFCNFSLHSTWISKSYYTPRNIFGNNRSRANNCSTPNGYTRINYHI